MKKLNDVLGYDLKIYQDTDYFCFSNDSIILASLVNIRLSYKNILDLGTGNGIIPLILSKRCKAKIKGVEIQKDLFDLAVCSVNYNKLNNRINIINDDILEFYKNEKVNSYDLIVCNPPYFKKYDGTLKNKDMHKVIARHEVKITIEEIIKVASILLKDNRVFAFVNRVDRLFEIIDLLNKYNLNPKYLRFIHDNLNKDANLFFMECIKNGKSGIKIDKPFIMKNLDGSNTLEYNKLFGSDSNAK